MLPRSTSGKGEQIMIYTVTFNPAIDYVVHPAQVVLGEVNRSSAEEIYFGGKGINVSAVLKELGFRSKALGFTAGFTGEAIERGVAAMGVDADFVRLKNGSSRINVKINSAEETEINCQGPDIDMHWTNFLTNSTRSVKATFWCWRAVSRRACPQISMSAF